MVFCAQALLLFVNAQRRDQALAGMTNRIVGKPRWGVEQLRVATDREGQNGVVTELRFTSNVDQEDLLVFVQSQTGPLSPQPGSIFMLHDCPHDEGAGQPCALAQTVTW